MPHFKVSDESHAHPKAVMAGDAAWGMWNRAGCWSCHYGTDGFVPDWWVKQQPQGRSKAKKLIEVQLWHPGAYEGDRPEYQGQTGFNFHEWRQDSYAQVEADREKSRKRKEAQRVRESRRDMPCDIPRDEPRDSDRDSAGTPGYTPYPLPPVVTSGGGGTFVDASEAPPPCPDHPENSDEPCRKCKRRRIWEESHAEQAAADQLDARRRAKAAEVQARQDAINACSMCDEFGEITFDDAVAKCTHRKADHA